MTQAEPKPRTEQLANPFRPGNGVPPPYLAGRDGLLAEFERYLGEARPPHPNWTLTGIRGTGKTVLLNEFATRGERSGWLAVERELGDRQRDDERLTDAVVADCETLARRCDLLAGVEQAVDRAWRQLRPRRLEVASVAYEPAYEGRLVEPAERMRTALIELDMILADHNVAGAILLYDEAHLLADDRGRERYPLSSLLAAIGHVQRETQRVRIVLCGLPTLSMNLKRARTYAERMFRNVRIDNLERGDAWDAIGIPLAGSGRTFALPVIGEIVEQTDGYPYLIQYFSSFLCSRTARASVELAAFRGLEPSLLHELDLAFFEDRYQGAGPAGRRVLEAIARHSARATAISLRRALPEIGNVDEHLRRLVERGLLYRPSRGTYDFALPLFRSYLRRRSNLTVLP